MSSTEMPRSASTFDGDVDVELLRLVAEDDDLLDAGDPEQHVARRVANDLSSGNE